jgi:hypothetical protein
MTNPMIGSGVQQTRGMNDGVNCQGGAKPRRWNETCRWQWQAETPPKWETTEGAWEWTS